MTVYELVQKLSTMPPEAPVVLQDYDLAEGQLTSYTIDAIHLEYDFVILASIN